MRRLILVGVFVSLSLLVLFMVGNEQTLGNATARFYELGTIDVVRGIMKTIGM